LSEAEDSNFVPVLYGLKAEVLFKVVKSEHNGTNRKERFEPMITATVHERKSAKGERRLPEIALRIVVLDDPELTNLFREEGSEVAAKELRGRSALARRRPYELD
jgi:hypothetical protein